MYLCLWLEQTNQILTCLLLSGISERDLMRNGISICYSVCYTTSDPWAPFRHHVQYCILAHTWSRISENCHSFLSSTRLSQVISRIHLAGLGGQVLRSREAPPERWQIKYKTGQLQNDDVWSGFLGFLGLSIHWQCWPAQYGGPLQPPILQMIFRKEILIGTVWNGLQDKVSLTRVHLESRMVLTDVWWQHWESNRPSG